MKYLLYLIKHKWLVFLECCKMGIWYRGILHDLSCFLPSEFRLSAKYFVGKPGEAYRKEAFSDPAFDLVRLRHHRRNGHHWQHWVLILDSGKMRPVEMPEEFVKEMWCDWVVAGRLQGNDTGEWLDDHLDYMILHPETRIKISGCWLKTKTGIDGKWRI